MPKGLIIFLKYSVFSLFECYDMTEKLYKEVKKIATEINNFLNEGNSDERK